MKSHATDIRSRADSMAKDASETVSEYYESANQWWQQNYGKTLAVAGILGAIGFLGFYFGRKNSK